MSILCAQRQRKCAGWEVLPFVNQKFVWWPKRRTLDSVQPATQSVHGWISVLFFRWGRRWPLAVFHIIAGLALGVTLFIPKTTCKYFYSKDNKKGNRIFWCLVPKKQFCMHGHWLNTRPHLLQLFVAISPAVVMVQRARLPPLQLFLSFQASFSAYKSGVWQHNHWSQKDPSASSVCNIVVQVLCCCFFSANGTNLLPLIMTFNMIGKFGITGSFGTVFLYAPEIFPTTLR